MRATILDEPKLDFGHGGSHEDPRRGIADYGPVDLGTRGARTRIRVGLVGRPKGSQVPVPGSNDAAPGSRRRPTTDIRGLFQSFPGFNTDRTFRSELVFDDTWMRAISNRQIGRILTKPVPLATAECVDLYHREIAHLKEKGRGCNRCGAPG